MTQTDAYAERARAHAARRDEEARLSRRISRLRLATFIPGAALLGWFLARGGFAWLAIAGVAFLAAFAALVVWHARVDERVEWFDALRLVHERARARIARDWNALPPAEAPPSEDLVHHPYALDLDLFGRASLGQWLGPAATPHGAALLARWLLHPAAPDEIRQRQEAIDELAGRSEWREELAAHGQLAGTVRAADVRVFLEWAEGPAVFGRHTRVWHAAVLVLTAAIWISVLMHAAGLSSRGYWPLPVLIGMVLSFATAKQVHGTFNRAGSGQRSLSRYAGLFEHATAAPHQSQRLGRLRGRLTAAGALAPMCMHRLFKILGFSELRTGAAIFHFPVQALTLWDFHVVFALDRWRRDVGSGVRDWMEALGELDALCALARVRADNPGWAIPTVSTSATVQARDLGHPLIPDDRRVGNDVEVGPPGTVLLITGSNMSGKSTLLRAVGLNVVLAQSGAPACATALTLPPSDLQTSIRIQDSLELGLSYFMAALARLKGVVDAAEHERADRILLYLLDEILQGTNSAERSIAVRGVARHLLEAGAIGAMTTHDLAVAAEPPLDTSARLVHFTEIVDEHGNMSFDYRLRPGLATSRNALRLMKMIGLDL
jgi:hypothetical protein